MKPILLLGIVLLLVGLGIVAAGSAGQGSVSAGGVVFIGPFPFVFGSGPAGWELALVSVVIGGVMLILLLLWGRRLSGQDEDESESIK